MRYLIATFVLATLLTASACGQTADPDKVKDQITGDAKGAASANPMCKLFTQAEIEAYAGAPAGPGENAAGGAGCNWHDASNATSVSVTVVTPDYFPEPDAMDGFKRLPDVGTRGWVAPDSGWSAGAIVADRAFAVGISGKSATEASVTALLKEAIKRHKQ
ncbi:MAG: hypothetical protein WBP11_01090 [Dokdonella sp.]